MNVVVRLVFELLFLSQTAKILSRISLKYSGDAYSFQFGMQLPAFFMGCKMVILRPVEQVNVAVSLVFQVLFLSQRLNNVFVGIFLECC